MTDFRGAPPPKDYRDAMARRAKRKQRESGERSSSDSWRCPVIKGGEGRTDEETHDAGSVFTSWLALLVVALLGAAVVLGRAPVRVPASRGETCARRGWRASSERISVRHLGDAVSSQSSHKGSGGAMSVNFYSRNTPHKHQAHLRSQWGRRTSGSGRQCLVGNGQGKTARQATDEGVTLCYALLFVALLGIFGAAWVLWNFYGGGR